MAFFISSFDKVLKNEESEFKRVFLLCENAPFTVLKNISLFLTKTGSFFGSKSFTTAESTLGAGTKAPLGTVNKSDVSAKIESSGVFDDN